MSTQKLEPRQAVEGLPTSLDSLRDSRLRVVEPLTVTWEIEDGTYIVESAEADEWGKGETPEAALADLQLSIAEGYFELDEYRDRLGRDLQRIYDTMNRKLERTDAPDSS